MDCLTSLPEDMAIEIATRVASSSPSDHVNFILSCTTLGRISQTDDVYRRMEMDYMRGGPWFPHQMKIFRRCLDCENPHAQFFEGMSQYFRYSREDEALHYLRRAVESEHAAASYLLAMLYIYFAYPSGDQYMNEEGLTNLKSLIFKKITCHCRQEIQVVANSLWIVNKLDLNWKPRICLRHLPEGRGRGGIPYYAEDLPCDDCMCDREINMFFDMLS